MAFTTVYADERKDSAKSFLRKAAAYFATYGVSVQRVLTNSGPVFHSLKLGNVCTELGSMQKITRASRPQTNDKAERFIQPALREWDFGRAYATFEVCRAALPVWNHFFNWHHPHNGIGCLPPMSRFKGSRKRLLTLHT